jgi:hypothetical protein
LDNEKLKRLRKAHQDGNITGGELKRIVIDGCMKLRKVDIHETVGDELKLIGDSGLRDYLYVLLERMPRYFWHVPASIMGFHDINSDNMMGGLVRHSKKVARVAQRIGEPYGLDHNADDLVVAGLLHDSFKYGETGNIPRDQDHATFAASWYETNGIFNDRPQIRSMIRTHLGRWGKVRPGNDLDWAFHIADYVVSRGAVPTAKTGRYHVMIPAHRSRR